MLAILVALRLFFYSFQGKLLVESDSCNAISWILNNEVPWRLHFSFAEIRFLAYHWDVEFQHVRWSANAMANSLAKRAR